MLETDSIAANIEAIRENIARAAERSGRSGSAVTLIAVTKTLSPERISEAIRAGITHVGENKVQEAHAKFAPGGTGLTDTGKVSTEGLTLHMIGSLQRNKVRDALSLFSWIHSVDRAELLKELEKEGMQEHASNPPLPVLLQVNLTAEPSKSGVEPGEIEALATAATECKHIIPRGLMTIARQGASERELHQTFARLRGLLERLRQNHPGPWDHLSMGMSDDYEAAVEEGATMVRLGRAIFGERT